MAVLYDMLTRHQIFLEGVKVYGAQKFNARLRAMQTKLQELILSVPHDNMGQMTRTELNALVKKIARIGDDAMKEHEKEILFFLLTLMSADLELSREIFSIDRPEPVAAKPKPLVPTKVIEKPKELWAHIEKEPLPSDGSLLPLLIAGFGGAVVADLIKQTRMAYANNKPPKSLVAAIIGTKSRRYNDGVFAKFYRQNSAIVATGVQHVSSVLQATLASFIYDEYEWVSVIDDRTTDICNSRDGNVYRYGEGPLPPAHYNCRSKTVPELLDEFSISHLRHSPAVALSGGERRRVA